MVTWDFHMGWSHGTVTWDGSYGMVKWDGCYFQPIRDKYLPQNWGIYKMCDIQISDKILKTPRTEMRFCQDSHMLAISFQFVWIRLVQEFNICVLQSGLSPLVHIVKVLRS